MRSSAKTIKIQYYALLREQRGQSGEEIETFAETVKDLYEELQARYGFTLPLNLLKVSVNCAFQSWESLLQSGDSIVFIPPVAGG